ncbi:hypothetical protein ARSEF1564_010167 [Beauveria bassiana]
MKSIAVVLTGLAVLAAAEQTNKRASATDPTPPTLEQLCVGFTNDDTCQREAHICLTKTGVKRGKDFWEKISTCLEGRHPPPLDQLCAGFTDRNVCQRATQACADEIGENDWVKITTCLEGKPHGLATFDRGEDQGQPQGFATFDRGEDQGQPQGFATFDRGEDQGQPQGFATFDRGEDQGQPQEFATFDRAVPSTRESLPPVRSSTSLQNDFAACERESEVCAAAEASFTWTAVYKRSEGKRLGWRAHTERQEFKADLGVDTNCRNGASRIDFVF